MGMDYEKIQKAAEGYGKDMTAFLRAIVANPGESSDEKAHVETIAAEMKKLDFDEVVIDPEGNVITDDTRIRESLKTINYLIDNDCKVIIPAVCI